MTRFLDSCHLVFTKGHNFPNTDWSRYQVKWWEDIC